MFKKIYYKLRYRNLISLVAKGTDIGQEESYAIIRKYRKIFEVLYGRNFVKEVILNYRIHYHNKKEKIINLYITVISNKQIIYKSDIAITLNLLNKYNLKNTEREAAYSVLSKYFGKLPNFRLKALASELIEEGKRNR